uniref:Uncharacterized protein n=1 Tax=Anopheles farauti TaxID=69004 RepID=A0A182QC81_9DIPT
MGHPLPFEGRQAVPFVLCLHLAPPSSRAPCVCRSDTFDEDQADEDEDEDEELEELLVELEPEEVEDLPSVLNYRQVERITNGPVEMVSIPVPLQYWHLPGLVPGSHREPVHFGHVSTTFTSMSLLTPRAACAKVRFIITSCAPPNPNLESLKSSKPCWKPPSPKILRKSSSGSIVERNCQFWENPCGPAPGRGPPLRPICSDVCPNLFWVQRGTGQCLAAAARLASFLAKFANRTERMMTGKPISCTGSSNSGSCASTSDRRSLKSLEESSTKRKNFTTKLSSVSRSGLVAVEKDGEERLKTKSNRQQTASCRTSMHTVADREGETGPYGDYDGDADDEEPYQFNALLYDRQLDSSVLILVHCCAVVSRFSMMYPVTSEPPFVSGACHSSFTLLLVTFVIRRFRGADDSTVWSGSLVPTLFLAVILKSYALFIARFSIRSDVSEAPVVPATFQTFFFASFTSTTYSVILVPPFDSDGCHMSVNELLVMPDVSIGPRGGDGGSIPTGFWAITRKWYWVLSSSFWMQYDLMLRCTSATLIQAFLFASSHFSMVNCEISSPPSSDGGFHSITTASGLSSRTTIGPSGLLGLSITLSVSSTVAVPAELRASTVYLPPVNSATTFHSSPTRNFCTICFFSTARVGFSSITTTQLLSTLPTSFVARHVYFAPLSTVVDLIWYLAEPFSYDTTSCLSGWPLRNQATSGTGTPVTIQFSVTD